MPRLCHERPLEGAAGVAVQRWRAPGDGIATARLEGTRFSDWDLAVFAADGTRLGASTSFGAAEQALARVGAGEEVLVQACRRLGSDASVPLSIRFDALARGGGPAAQLVEVAAADEADVRRLEATGLDVTHDVEPGRASVVVYSPAQRALLDGLGLATRTVEPDMAAADAADRRREARAAPSAARALPTGRTTYRQPQDYTTDMKTLAEGNPALVRKLTLPRASLEGRPIEGVEIAAGVRRTDDGRPVYLQMGAHHAREWPSAELPMEFAVDLVRRYNQGDARVRSLLDRVRVVVVPVVNVDGFAVSRGAGPSPADDNDLLTAGLALNDQSAYKRKNCRATVGSAAISCAARSAAGTGAGVDLNRNYGAYWGGSGSSDTPSAQGYRGPSPFSEPESEAVHRFTSGLQVVTFITNHTFTDDGKFLRQPGFDDVIAVAPDEPRMKALGDAMAAATGWTSELGYATLGDITGATEDWNYFAQGTFGYTPEARGTNFHANYADSVIGEYDGSRAPSGGGIYEAFMVAGEQAANPAGHSVITGTAPAGRVLRLRKQFTTATSQAGVSVPDALDTTMTVPASGRYTWHVNPSKRPLFPRSPEGWTMTCQDGSGRVLGTALVNVARGARATQDFACGGPATGGGGSARCASATGRIGGKALERARLGRKQSTVRTAFARGRRTKGSIDRFCLAGGGAVRVGYPSAGLRRKLSRRERARVKGRAILLLGSGTRTRLRKVAPGASTRTLTRRIGKVKPIRVGSARWYLRGGAGARHVFRVTGGKVREVGLADARQTASRARAKRLFASFR
ncbi:MAG TPA: M14 family zinc carboxypeptidase [Thermoleophilaceae bacterium]|nr:M14 family zinc carboxypeptidase [Thermoleophilaceae bacterium]